MAFEGADFKGPNGVNVAEILRVADAVERSTTFEMADTYHDDCGTPACIYGHLVPYNEDRHGWVAGTERLGITEWQGQQLFSCLGTSVNLSDVTPQWAAACLRKLAVTGVVDWIGTKPTN